MKFQFTRTPFMTLALGLASLAQAGVPTAPDATVEAYVDAQMRSLAFPLSTTGDTKVDALRGQAAELFKFWQASGGNPQIHAMTDNGKALWAITAQTSNLEIGGDFISHIAMFSADTGDALALGDAPPNPIHWHSDLSIGPLDKPAQYSPELLATSKAQDAKFFIEKWEALFDETAIKNKVYSGVDQDGKPLKMSWKVQDGTNGTSLVVDFVKGTKTVNSFTLDSTSQIAGSNSKQFDATDEGPFLVVQRKIPGKGYSTLWIFTSEGNTIVRIGTEAEPLKVSPSDPSQTVYFNANTQ